MFTAALSAIAKIWKKQRCGTHTHTHKYYSAIKK